MQGENIPGNEKAAKAEVPILTWKEHFHKMISQIPKTPLGCRVGEWGSIFQLYRSYKAMTDGWCCR